MSALLDVIAGTARLSRRDRAALTLALECVRRSHGGYWGARSLLYIGADYTRCVSRDVLDAMPTTGNIRAARARLALMLRLVLRCDAWTRADEDWGDFPPGVSPWFTPRMCSRCGHRLSQYEIGEVVVSGACCGARIERVVPLWERAPARRAR